MNQDNQTPPDSQSPPPYDDDKPVAYDQYGRPLYAHPPKHTPHQVVQVTRPIDPIEPIVSPEMLHRHEESRKKYPGLNLSKGEYVISAVRRHPIGLIQIWFISAMLVVACMALLANFFLGPNASSAASTFGDEGTFRVLGTAGLLLVVFMAVIGGLVATYVYTHNRFYLTNESIIQEIQTSLFSRHEQTVSLANVEDASFLQGGIIQAILNYGTIRLSTEGEETTYRFSYVANPKKHIAILNNAVEAFKNGRPVTGLPNDD